MWILARSLGSADSILTSPRLEGRVLIADTVMPGKESTTATPSAENVKEKGRIASSRSGLARLSSDLKNPMMWADVVVIIPVPNSFQRSSSIPMRSVPLKMALRLSDCFSSLNLRWANR